MENGPFIDGLPIKNGDFPMAMLNNQRVYTNDVINVWLVYPQKLVVKSTKNYSCQLKMIIFFFLKKILSHTFFLNIIITIHCSFASH